MNCTNCKDIFCFEANWFLRGIEKMQLCDNCGGSWYDGIYEKEGWQRLTEKQIARIERIRAERAAAKDNKHYYRECVGCGDTPCVKPDDPIDPPYCEYCTRICDEIRVDDRDSPNIFPYKRCRECGERKSCGSYQNKRWFCEDCSLGCHFCDCDLGPDSGNTPYESTRGYVYCESCGDKE
jgi:hypothetical protein